MHREQRHLRTERNVTAKKPDPSEQAPPSDDDTITDEQIAARAYEISQSEDAGSDEENWARAERKLRSPHEKAAGG
jgi:hypothetical protein